MSEAPPDAPDTTGVFIDTTMSEQATVQRSHRQHWAAPGGQHDRLVAILKKTLPIAVGVLTALLAVAPFTHQNEVSFVLDKKKVDMSAERLKVVEALYRGEDANGRPFSIRAGSAVQKSSREPIVQLTDLEARLELQSGGALVTAQHGQYDLNKETVAINGPIQFESADGYRLTTRDVDIALDARTLHSRGQVDGRMPTGNFSADHVSADLAKRTVSLDGHARLRIDQFGRKGR